MKIRDIIVEAPLAQYEPIGNFDKAHSFRSEVDRKLATHPTNIKKIHTFLEKSRFDFRVFVANLKGAAKYAEHGQMQYTTFRDAFGQESADTVFSSGMGTENAITIVYVGNSGADRVMFTPWIMAHRFGHAIQATTRRRWSPRAGDSTPWSNTERYFFRGMNELLSEYYRQQMNTRGDMEYSKAAIYNAFFNSIGTMRSARTGKINRPYEFLYECFAQYLQSGEVKFNPLKTNIPYGRKAWGNPTQALYGRNIDDSVNQQLQDLAQGLTEHFEEVLMDCEGKVFVM